MENKIIEELTLIRNLMAGSRNRDMINFLMEIKRKKTLMLSKGDENPDEYAKGFKRPGSAGPRPFDLF